MGADNSGLSPRGKIILDLISDFNKLAVFRDKRDEKLMQSDMEKPFLYPERFTVVSYDMGNFTMEMLSLKEKTSDCVVLQLHGGGYVGAMKNRYRMMAGIYSEISDGADVLTIDYRVAPQNVFPAALDDAVAAYNWLLLNEYSADKIILAGDSAGGGLAMALCHYLKDHEIPLPKAIVAMSPWTDLTSSGPSYKENFKIDPVFGNERASLIYDSVYVGDADPTNPYISPLFGDFTGFPPMLIQVGTQEMLYSDSVQAAEKAKAAGVKVKLSIYEGMFHVFQAAANLMPESRRAWSEVRRFFEILGISEEREKLPDNEGQEEFRDKVNLVFESMKDKAENIKTSLQDKADDLKESMKETTVAIKDKISTKNSDGESATES